MSDPIPWLCPRDHTCTAKRTHDTDVAYDLGCRSGSAREANYRHRKQLRAGVATPRLTSSLGTRRRLQSLYAIGWRWADLAAASGLSERWLGRVAYGREAPHYVTSKRAAAVVELFDRKAMEPGGCIRTRNYAYRAGWVPPLAWTNPDDPDEQPDLGGGDKHADENVVAAVMAGRLTWDRMTTADQDHLVVTLMRRGWETAAIADRAGTTRAAAYRAYDRSRARERRGAAA